MTSNINTRPEDWLTVTPQGLYCAPGDFYIDPPRAVARAVITHGHADHARPGHEHALATPQTLDIIRHRFGTEGVPQGQALAYGETLSLGDVTLRQIVLEHRGQRIVVSGDYKRRADPTCAPFEVVTCDVFITEATFGLPVFRHPDARDEVAKVLHSQTTNPDRCVLVGVYALGKALRGQIVLAPPSAARDRWARRLPNPVIAVASGWMGVRARARQRGAELPLTISDHADWDELTGTIHEVEAGEIWVTHGREDALIRYATLQGITARALSLVDRDEEEAE